ncbi:MAG: bifunctional folylpolyglutamate synthase/dihydrofolate synthase, partial [Ferruginibacter sp.]
VIETGLGGRLDSTNIITPILSIITNIGYDHTDILGDTLEKIAAEKAGIIKPGVPVVIGEYLPETKSVFLSKAEKERSPVFFAQDGYQVIDVEYTATQLSCMVTDADLKVSERFTCDLNGLYQTHNLKTVLCAEGVLMQLGCQISNEAEKYALANVKKLTGLYGRWDVISEKPTIILDVAHNEDGIKQLLYQLSAVHQTANTVHFIIGMVKDKDISKVLSILPKNAQYYFSNAHIERALNHRDLLEKARTYELNGESFDDVNEAISAAIKKAATDEIIIVFGSVFLVAEVNKDLFTL